MRGYSLCEFPLPVIVVNRKDSYSARSFTMLHEFVHLMLHSSGICDLKTRRDAKPEDQKAEVFCNHVAGASLVPEKKLLHEPIIKQNTTQNWPDESLDELAMKYSVSREVMLRRLLILSRTNEIFYKMKRKQYQSEFKKKETSGFVPPSINVISASGKTFVRLVLDSFYSNRITLSDVSEYLGVKLKHFDKISHKLGMG